MGVHIQVLRRLAAATSVFAALAALPAASQARAVSALPPTAPATFDVVPGGVVRWTGDRISLCGDDRETWAPIGGACYYPVDLAVRESTFDVFRERSGARETAAIRVLASPYAEESLEVDPGKVRLSPRAKRRVERERRQVAPLFSLRTHAEFTLPLGSPLADAPPPRNFGTRRVLNGEARAPHGGADYRARVGTPVLAAEKGIVVLVANHFFAGRSVYVDHGGGLLSMYMHLSRTLVKVGRRVAKGQRLGLTGATGRVSGPHLHFGLRWRGARVDPAPLISGSGVQSCIVFANTRLHA